MGLVIGVRVGVRHIKRVGGSVFGAGSSCGVLRHWFGGHALLRYRQVAHLGLP